MPNIGGLAPGDKWGPRDRYEIVRELGRGGMGIVFLAEDRELSRSVALKLIRADYTSNDKFQKRLNREYKLHARVGFHPHLVAILDVFDTEGTITLVLEYVEGQTLRQWMRATPLDDPRRRPLTVRFIAQCLDAVDTIHSCGIIHRDIKPDNILLQAMPGHQLTAKLMDFGIARLTLDDEGSQLTNAGGLQPGTPRYIAPEQIDEVSFGRVSPATDIYALGVTLYEALAGCPPFIGEMAQVFQAHLNSSVPSFVKDAGDLQGLALQAVIELAMAKQPADRYPSGREFRKSLLAAMDINSNEVSESILGRKRGSPDAELPAPIPVIADPITAPLAADEYTRFVDSGSAPAIATAPPGASASAASVSSRASVRSRLLLRRAAPASFEDPHIITQGLGIPKPSSIPRRRLRKAAIAAVVFLAVVFAPWIFSGPRRSDFGISAHDVPVDWKASVDGGERSVTQGAMIMKVRDAGPAQLAGVQVFDVVLEFNGRPVAGSAALEEMIRRTAPGSIVELKILRGGAEGSETDFKVHQLMVTATSTTLPNTEAAPRGN